MTNPYDLVRYPNWAVSETHPASLNTFATLYGRPAARLSACRVLEIGCGEGVNLMSMAVGAPKSEFIGIDLAEAPVEMGSAMARAAGLANVTLQARDLCEDTSDLGEFDYIIAHGVYAWVPAVVQRALMRLAAERLRPDGLFFVSYNALPGCRLRQALRDVMLSRAQGVSDPVQRLDIAREALARFAGMWSADDPFQNALIEEARDALERPPTVLYHDELGGIYAPQLLSEVVAAARAEGLAYLCDAKQSLSSEILFPSELQASEPRADFADFEQTLDFAAMRRFRRSIFCRPGGIDRALRPDRLKRLWASAEITPLESAPDDPDAFTFRARNGAEITTRDASFAKLLTQLGEAYPQSLQLDGVVCDASHAEPLLRLFTAKIVTLLTERPAFTLSPGERPRASPLARAQAAQGDAFLASLLHKPVQMEDATARRFVALLDGSLTRAELAQTMEREVGVGGAAALARTHAALADMARLGLMAA